jgi:hypothetical protein
MIKKLFIIGLMLSASISALAQSIPGEYITEKGWGNLKIKKDKDGSTKFDIGAMGANGHSCGLDGTIKNGVAKMDPDGAEPNEKCTVKFKNTEKGIEVIPNGDGCRYYCGMRASFDGNYLKVSQECTNTTIVKIKKEFLSLYKSKKYEEAISKLEPVINNCSKTLYWLEDGRIRNDLAVAYAKVKKFNECSKILDPLKEDAQKDEEDLKNEYSPSDAESYWSIIKSTKTNLKLCKLK